MPINEALLIIGLVALVESITPALKFSSPCPGLFHYDSTDQPNQWNGTVTLLSDTELHGVWLRLIFDEKLTEVNNNFGEVILSDDKQEVLIKKRNYLLKPGTPTDVKITVKYESNKSPTLIGYRLNANMVCSSQENISNKFGLLYLGDLNNKDFLASFTSQQKPSYKEFEDCGTAPLSSNHEPANKKGQNGQWPWQGAIYIQNNNVEKYVCEAILISSRQLLAPAHCLTYQESELVVPLRQLTVYLGKYSYSSDEENKEIQKFGVENILVYPGYRAKKLLNDLAIIQLDKPVIISDYVRPVCLKQFTDKSEGFLVGYGINGDKIEDLGHAKVQIIPEEKCLEKNSHSSVLLSDNVFCTTYDGDSSCVGSSGSSLVTLRDGAKPVWELKGVVTVGPSLQEKYVCNESSTVFLLNVANYLKWIQENVS